MLQFAAAVELLGVILLGIPVIRVMVAHLKIIYFDTANNRSIPDLKQIVREGEMRKLIFPSLVESTMVIAGVFLCAASAFIKLIYYSH